MVNYDWSVRLYQAPRLYRRDKPLRPVLLSAVTNGLDKGIPANK
jgi:hypothetical protein